MPRLRIGALVQPLHQTCSLAAGQLVLAYHLGRTPLVAARQSRELARAEGLDWIDLRKVVIPMSAIELVPESVARENTMLPLTEEDGALVVVVHDPYDNEILEKLRFVLNRRVEHVIAPKSHIEAAIEWYYSGPARRW